MSRRSDHYERYDRPFDQRASARPYYHHGSRHTGGGALVAVAAIVAVAVFLILQGLNSMSSQPVSTRLSVAAKEPPISRAPANTGYVTADDVNLRAVAAKEPPISRAPANTGTGYVTADDVILRKDPRSLSVAIYILPKGTDLTLFGEAHRDLNNTVWLRVSVETLNGWQSGWVHERYVSGAKRDSLQY